MKDLNSSNLLTSHFIKLGEDNVSNVFKAVQAKLEKELNLGPNIRLSGLSFETVSEHEVNLSCTKMCPEWVGGHLHLRCCRP